MSATTHTVTVRYLEQQKSCAFLWCMRVSEILPFYMCAYYQAQQSEKQELQKKDIVFNG